MGYIWLCRLYSLPVPFLFFFFVCFCLSVVCAQLKDQKASLFFYAHLFQTLLYTLPRLSCVSDDEWMHPDLFYQLDCSWQTASHFHLLPLYNESKALAACEPGPWKMKAAGRHDVCCANLVLSAVK